MSQATFQLRAHKSLRDTQMSRNIGKATANIRAKTAKVSTELPDWEQLRDAGRAIKRETLARLDTHLEALEASVTLAGGVVHWARDAAEARAVVHEIELNPALSEAGITPYETDLADMIVQMAREKPSHLLVPPSTRTAPRSANCSAAR